MFIDLNKKLALGRISFEPILSIQILTADTFSGSQQFLWLSLDVDATLSVITVLEILHLGPMDDLTQKLHIGAK